MKTKFAITPKLVRTQPAASLESLGFAALQLPEPARRVEQKPIAGFLYFREDENTVWDYWFQSCAAD